MQDSEFNDKVVPWIKSFAEDVDSRSAALKFTSDHLGICRRRFKALTFLQNFKIYILFASSRNSFVSRQGLCALVGFLLLLFVLTNLWSQIDVEVYEVNNSSLYKLVNFVGGIFRGRKDVD